jgi:hypothetical protein
LRTQKTLDAAKIKTCSTEYLCALVNSTNCANETCSFSLEKGTDKTAYAVCMSNTSYRQILAHHKFIRETDYQQFVSLNQTKNLTLSNYTDIWTILLLLLLSAGIYITVSKTPFLLGYPKFRALRDAIDEYYNHAFSPEIITALRFIENADLAAELVAKYAGAGVTLRQARTSKKAPRKSVFRRTCYFFKRVLKRLSLL